MKWEQAWLDYSRQNELSGKEYFRSYYNGYQGQAAASAAAELQRAAEGLFGVRMAETTAERAAIRLLPRAEGDEESFCIRESKGSMTIESRTERGALYGVFRFLQLVRTGELQQGIQMEESPMNPLRMLNHWDNLDGSIERGYSGRSFFFKDGQFLPMDQIRDYARLAASVAINGIVINNVNVTADATDLINKRYRKPLVEISEIFASYGIKLYLSLNFAAPIEVGGLKTADPLDPDVASWWGDKMTKLYQMLPNLGGFVVKADSEGRPGPFTYNRNHADGANVLAKAIEPHGGIIIWRCFVYNCQQDWRDYKTDRAKAGYDCFKPLDGTFADNVILQIKNGPMDFQVREAVSPLLGAMERTNQMLEFQIAQEYTGQQRHVCYLIPWWKEVLNFRTYSGKALDTVADAAGGRTYGNALAGIAAVTNTGDDPNWTGHDLAGANLYGYGRLCWNTDLAAENIAAEWIRLALTSDEQAVKAILDILMNSWPAYEKYTSPLGIGWMVTPHTHYGPSIDGYEYDRWGTYHRADHLGMGVDRSSRGTGYTQQYFEPNAGIYEDLRTCPEELLLFFHHVPYVYQLKSGKTLIQHIYDSHFEGVEDVKRMREIWDSIEKYIDPVIHKRVKQRLEEQENHAREWRDVVNSYFYRKSGICDEKKRKIY